MPCCSFALARISLRKKELDHVSLLAMLCISTPSLRMLCGCHHMTVLGTFVTQKCREMNTLGISIFGQWKKRANIRWFRIFPQSPNRGGLEMKFVYFLGSHSLELGKNSQLEIACWVTHLYTAPPPCLPDHIPNSRNPEVYFLR